MRGSGWKSLLAGRHWGGSGLGFEGTDCKGRSSCPICNTRQCHCRKIVWHVLKLYIVLPTRFDCDLLKWSERGHFVRSNDCLFAFTSLSLAVSSRSCTYMSVKLHSRWAAEGKKFNKAEHESQGEPRRTHRPVKWKKVISIVCFIAFVSHSFQTRPFTNKIVLWRFLSRPPFQISTFIPT